MSKTPNRGKLYLAEQFTLKENTMSKFLDDFRVALDKVAQGRATDAETKAAITELRVHLLEKDATDAEQSTAINELVAKLANSTPTP